MEKDKLKVSQFVVYGRPASFVRGTAARLGMSIVGVVRMFILDAAKKDKVGK